MDFNTFDELMAHVNQLVATEQFDAAIETATATIERFKHNEGLLLFFSAQFAARNEDADRAFDLLRQMLKANYWGSDYGWRNPAFNGIRGQATFDELYRESRTVLAVFQRDARPEWLTIPPYDYAEIESFPLLVALHGNNSSVRWHHNHWRTATDAGWLVGMPQSSQVAGHDTEGGLVYVWNDVPRAEQEIGDFFGGLNKAYMLKDGQMVVGGFSRGGEMAIYAAVTGLLPVQGFIAVCPGGPLTLDDGSLWEPIIKEGEGHQLRGHIIMGGQDMFVEGTEKLVDLLENAGITVEFEVHDDMGHDYPPDFRERLVDLLQGTIKG